MSQDLHSLQRELKFIEDSYKSGIITRQEYEAAKKRVEDKLADLPKEGPTDEKSLNQETEKPTVEVYHEEKSPAPKKSGLEKGPSKTANKPPAGPQDHVRLETYGNRFFDRSNLIIMAAVALLLIVIIVSINLPEKVEPNLVAVCSTDLDCYKPGFLGNCLDAGTRVARCEFTSAKTLQILVIEPKECPTCNPDRMENTLRQLYPGARFTRIPESSAADLIDDLKITVLPAYLINSSVEDTERFGSTSSILEKQGDYYVVKPIASGASYFFMRDAKKDSLLLFMNPFGSASEKAFENLLDMDYDMDYEIRYYSRDEDDLQEIYSQICMRELQESSYVDYMRCFFAQDETIDCTEGIDKDVIDDCISDDAPRLLEFDLQQAGSFNINTVPVFVFNNRFKKGGSLSVEILEDYFCKLNKC